MQRKSTNSLFIIDKKKLFKNLNALKSKNICFMIKANAYGHGLSGICEILRGKVKFFGVATLEEALIVRKIDMTTPILVVGISDFSDDEFLVYNVKKLINNNISITIDNLKQLQRILLILNKENKGSERKVDKTTEENEGHINETEKRKIKDKKSTVFTDIISNESFKTTGQLKLKIHIKINSGMNRLGINDLGEFKEILKILNGNKNLIFEGIYTHFATASSDILYLNKQLKTFEKFLKYVHPIFNPIVHLGGGDVVDLPEFQKLKYENYMFRVGLKLYTHPNGILKVKSRIIKILNLPRNSRIGYSNGFICEQSVKIAVIPLGYADGINRKLSGKGQVNINGRNHNIVGNVCMDMFFVDVTEAECVVGDEVTVFNNSRTWAEICDTIPYEILTGMNYSRMRYIVKN